MKEFILEIKELWQDLISILKSAAKLKIEAFRLRLAIWLADLLQKARNKRFFVVLVSLGWRRGKEIVRLRSICNSEFKEFKRRGWLPKTMSYLELSEKCFYQTDLKRNNTQSAEARQAALEKYLRFQRGMGKLV